MNRALGWMVLAVLVGLAALASLPGADVAKRRSVYPNKFPNGVGQSIATRSCLTCHSATLTTQQHKDSTGWEKTLRTMETWGVRLTPAERDTLLTYLRAKFEAPRK